MFLPDVLGDYCQELAVSNKKVWCALVCNESSESSLFYHVTCPGGHNPCTCAFSNLICSPLSIYFFLVFCFSSSPFF